MTLNTKALALTSAILWGLAMLAMSLANLIWGNYGQQFLQTMSSVYPGYHATRNIAEVIVGTLYGAVDGLVGGAVFAWLYNQFAKPGV
jgi:TRAP-type mannitol/chloroaromatic compound transport system permease large subunit